MAEPEREYWFHAAVALLIVAWALNVWVPVLLLRPMWEGDRQLATIEEAEDDAPAPSRPPGIITPLLALVVSLGAFTLGIWQMHESSEVGGRWLWATAAAGLAFLCAVLLLVMVIQVGSRYAQLYMSGGP